MFTWFKKIIPDTASNKPVIITVHGYGRRRKHEFDNLALWGKADGYDIVQFDMYDLFDENDNNWQKWVRRAKETVETYNFEKRPVILIGFSMGGVIASYLAATCKVEKLILLAPAFQYLHVEGITNMIVNGAANLINNDKKEDEIELPKSFYPAFTDVIKHLKPYIHEVMCPVLFIHGDDDEIIPIKSSINAFDKLTHDNKKLFIVHQGSHRLLMDERVNWEVYQMIRLFLDNKILNGITPSYAKDILEIYKEEGIPNQNKNGID